MFCWSQLAAQSSILALDLSENNLTNLGKNDDGATGVAQDIAGHASLTYLNLSHSRLDTPSLMALATALQVPPHSIPPCNAGVPLRVPFQRSKLSHTHKHTLGVAGSSHRPTTR